MQSDEPIRPLSARSVVVSLLLGAGPDGMSARQVVAAGKHFDLESAAVRVALTRAVASDDLRRVGSTYRLGPRLVARRDRQEQPVSEEPWDQSWEMVVVTATGRSAGERAALRTRLAALRLAELREGVWMRPANLVRSLVVSGPSAVQVLRSTPVGDRDDLTRALWDLDGWVKAVNGTRARLEVTGDPAQRLAVAAQLVRHLHDDPLLPVELWPPDWPAPAARAAYASYEQEVREITLR